MKKNIAVPISQGLDLLLYWIQNSVQLQQAIARKQTEGEAGFTAEEWQAVTMPRDGALAKLDADLKARREKEAAEELSKQNSDAKDQFAPTPEQVQQKKDAEAFANAKVGEVVKTGTAPAAVAASGPTVGNTTGVPAGGQVDSGPLPAVAQGTKSISDPPAKMAGQPAPKK